MPKKEVQPSQKDNLKHIASTKDSVTHLIVIAPKSSPTTHTINSSAHALSPSLDNISMSPSIPHMLCTHQLLKAIVCASSVFDILCLVLSQKISIPSIINNDTNKNPLMMQNFHFL